MDQQQDDDHALRYTFSSGLTLTVKDRVQLIEEALTLIRVAMPTVPREELVRLGLALDPKSWKIKGKVHPEFRSVRVPHPPEPDMAARIWLLYATELLKEF